MHYYALVVIPPEGAPERFVEVAMAPFYEELSDEGWWDWWVIGGRWTGHLDKLYDPQTDPDNIETCNICNGTGQRDWSTCSGEITQDWIDHCGGCNGCMGMGMKVKWSTQWKPFPGDVMPVRQALAAIEADPKAGLPYRFVAGEIVIACEEHNPDWNGLWGDAGNGYMRPVPDYDKTVIEMLRAVDEAWRVAIVDYHC